MVLASLGAYIATRGALRGQIDDSLRAQAHACRSAPGVRPERPAAAARRAAAERRPCVGFPSSCAGRPGRPSCAATTSASRYAADVAAARGNDTTAVLSDRAGACTCASSRRRCRAPGRSCSPARSTASTASCAAALGARDPVLVGTALAAAVSRLFARRVMAPVADLTAAAEHIEATGDLERRIDGAGDDELGRLARASTRCSTASATQGALGASLDASAG